MKDKPKEILYSVKSDKACGGIVVRDGIVIETAPYFKWMMGKKIEQLLQWNKNNKFVYLEKME